MFLFEGAISLSGSMLIGGRAALVYFCPFWESFIPSSDRQSVTTVRGSVLEDSQPSSSLGHASQVWASAPRGPFRAGLRAARRKDSALASPTGHEAFWFEIGARDARNEKWNDPKVNGFP